MKDVSQSGDLQLQHLTSSQQGTFTCELSGDDETYVTVTKLTRPGETHLLRLRKIQVQVLH